MGQPLKDNMAGRSIYSSQGHRSGSGKARITDAFFVHGGNIDVSYFRNGDVPRLMLRISSDIDMDRPAVGFILKTPDNSHITGSTSIMLGHMLPSISSGSDLVVGLRLRLNLVGGEYLLDLSLSDYEEGDYHICDWRQSQVHFHVSSEPTFFGLVDLDARIEPFGWLPKEKNHGGRD